MKYEVLMSEDKLRLFSEFLEQREYGLFSFLKEHVNPVKILGRAARRLIFGRQYV